MGREATCMCRWKDQIAEAKVLLEQKEIILRSPFRDRIERAEIVSFRQEGENLILATRDRTLTLQLGAAEAGKWAAALLKPPPSLANKLGIGDGRKGFVIGTVNDPELRTALDGKTVSTLTGADLIVAILDNRQDLEKAFDIARDAPALPLWCIHEKGPSAAFGDQAIRNFMRERAYIDSKSCAVSDRLTATRYGLRKPA